MHDDTRDLISNCARKQTVLDAGGKPHYVAVLGDLPVVAKDSKGTELRPTVSLFSRREDHVFTLYSFLFVDELYGPTPA